MAIDLSTVPAPAVVEALSFETILAAMLADLRTRDATFTALVESDPAYKILEVAAYRELLIRQRVNDGARQCMLAYASSTNLDNLAANYGIERLLITPANTTTVPPTPAVYETDASLRRRCLLSLDSLSVAGPANAYVFHALSAAPTIVDASVTSPIPGTVRVNIINGTGNGTPTAGELAAVVNALNAEDVRPLTDTVQVTAPTVVNYTITAIIKTKDGPDPAVVFANVQAAAAAFVSENHRIGQDITLSAVYAALHQSGVSRVTLAAPAADVTIDANSVAYCAAISLTNGGVDT